MKYLILLNRKFPYKSGEAFLENEIDEISCNFDKIIIYPSDVSIHDKQTRNINSKNVEAHILEENSLKSRKTKYMLCAPKYILEKSSAKNIKEKAFESYFLAAAHSQANAIIKDLEKINFKKRDKIYLYSYWLYINAKVACILKDYLKKKGLKVVVFSRAHRFDIYKENHKLGYIPQRKELLENLNHVFACSDNGAQYLRGNYPKYKEKISTGYLGTYDRGKSPRKANDKFRIVSCSRLSEVKRVNLIIEALSNLKDANLNLSWTHLGGGELYEQLKEEASSKLNWMEVNMPGQMSNTDVYNHYLNNRVNLFINVSSSEGLPVSIMEATSFEIPVIATDVGGTSEIVIEGENGYLLRENFKPEELSELIKKIAAMNKTEYNKLRKNARKIWETNYQAKVNYEKFSNEILKMK